MFMGVLGHVGDYAEARSIVNRLLDALPPGSHLALADSLGTGDGHAEAHERYEDSGAVAYHLRTAVKPLGPGTSGRLPVVTPVRFQAARPAPRH